MGFDGISPPVSLNMAGWKMDHLFWWFSCIPHHLQWIFLCHAWLPEGILRSFDIWQVGKTWQNMAKLSIEDICFKKKSKPQRGTTPIDGLWQAMQGEVVLPRFSSVKQKDSRECLIIHQIIGKICYQKNSKTPNIFNLSWWYTYQSEKYESQFGWWHSQYMEK